MPTGIDTTETTDSTATQMPTELSADTFGATAIHLPMAQVGDTARPKTDTVPSVSSAGSVADTVAVRQVLPSAEPETELPRRVEIPEVRTQADPYKPLPQTQSLVPTEKTARDTVFFFAKHTKRTLPLRADSSVAVTSAEAAPADSILQGQGIKVLSAYVKIHTPQKRERGTEVVSIDGRPMENTIQTHFWFTPCLFILFVLYAFTFASRKKTFTKKIRNLFSPTTSGERSVITPIEELQEQLPLLALASANIAWLAYFCTNTFFHATAMPFVAWLTSTVVIGATLALQLMLTQSVCYVFFDEETFHKIERLRLLTFSLTGICLIPSVLLLAYAPTLFTPFAIYWGIAVCALLFLLYLLRTIPFFFKGTLSIFYLILYLCTIEILPAIALVVGLERIN